MDRRVDPARDFLGYAAGRWMRTHPVPPDRTRWGGFDELIEYNFAQLRSLLEEAERAPRAGPSTSTRQIGDLYASALDLPRRERLRVDPIAADLRAVAGARDRVALFECAAGFLVDGGDAFFGVGAAPDLRQSDTYALYLTQGGLSLPDREYYRAKSFAAVRSAYRGHLERMHRLLGEDARTAAAHARTILRLETALARASRSRTALNEAEKNYHRYTRARLERLCPSVPWRRFFRRLGLRRVDPLVVGQPEFFRALDRELRIRPLSDWITYLRWQLLRQAAPYLHRRLAKEHFAFFQRTLLGQQRERPVWRRAVVEVDRDLGEALGAAYVARHFPPEARGRVLELVERVERAFRGRLERLPWMTPRTRRRALAKFARFTTKIGHPERFRDYRRVRIDRTDLYGNVRRSAAFETARTLRRVGGRVDRSEWRMTPPTVNAYFSPTQNEIVFPAGILQPPFFDVALDDAVNYGGIGSVIGHEITHGYDDQGRKYDADGNLRDWWTVRDAREFKRRAQRIVAQFDRFEALPKAFVNGALTEGENIADLGGVSLAFEALTQRLAEHPEERRTIDGFTPEQRFFLAYAQLWRMNIRDQDLRRRLTMDPHAPGRFRVLGPLANLPEFARAFDVPVGAPMRAPPERRVEIW